MSAEPLPDVTAVAMDVASRLERLAVPYLISGSLASSVHGEPRATFDVDVVADIQAHVINALITSLRPDYYVDEDAAQAAVETGGSFNAVHTRAGIKIDFFIAGNDIFELERLRTRVAIVVNDAPRQTLWMDTAEHILLRKLEWFRRGGEVSERQWRDILAIVELQGDALDRVELARWAPKLRVSDLLERCLQGRQA